VWVVKFTFFYFFSFLADIEFVEHRGCLCQLTLLVIRHERYTRLMCQFAVAKTAQLFLQIFEPWSLGVRVICIDGVRHLHMQIHSFVLHDDPIKLLLSECQIELWKLLMGHLLIGQIK